MTHLKRQCAPTKWPIPRKGTKFVVKTSSKGIPVLVLLRDILKIARTRKEVKKAILNKHVLVCGKIIKDDKKSVELFDTLTIVPTKKNYKLILSEKGKYSLEKIKDSQKEKKISKVVNKKTLKGKKIQINLLDGKNYLSALKCSMGDSVIIDLKKNQLERCLLLKENSKIFIIGGKHIGKYGTIENINKKLRNAEVKIGDEKVKVLIKQLIVIE